MTTFENRYDAGRCLAAGLEHLRAENVVVVGLPRGGVPVAYEVARALGAPLDVVVVRKLGLPFQREVAMGAIGEEGVRVLDRDLIARAHVPDSAVREVEERERGVLCSRLADLRSRHPRVDLRGRTVVLVDDGIATGATAHAGCLVVRQLGAARVVLAAPVAPAGTSAAELGADELVSCAEPRDFWAVGNYYRDFAPTSDHEVEALLERAMPAREVEVPVDSVHLPGRLVVPRGARAVVLFAHGSGSSRLSPRNRHVAHRLQDAGLGTLVFDLLGPEEDHDRRLVFDIPLLGNRLVQASRWLRGLPEVAGCRFGYFGASTGAAAALWAAAEPGSSVGAVVSRGGRPDLAGDRLGRVEAPTLLVVGGADPVVLDLNRRAQGLMKAETRLVVVPGASHLFEEPGALDEVARLAAAWFDAHLRDDGVAGGVSR